MLNHSNVVGHAAVSVQVAGSDHGQQIGKESFQAVNRKIVNKQSRVSIDGRQHCNGVVVIRYTIDGCSGDTVPSVTSN